MGLVATTLRASSGASVRVLAVLTVPAVPAHDVSSGIQTCAPSSPTLVAAARPSATDTSSRTHSAACSSSGEIAARTGANEAAVTTRRVFEHGRKGGGCAALPEDQFTAAM